MSAITIKRLILRITCNHKVSVWLRENSRNPCGGVYPVRCCLDCGKLIWANTTITDQGAVVEYLTPVTLSQMRSKP